MITFAVTCMAFGALRVVSQGAGETSDAAGVEPAPAQSPAAQSSASPSPIAVPTAEAVLGVSAVGTAIARTRSQQLIDQGYFAHTDPYGYTMYVELLRKGGYAWQLAGENLAKNDWPSASSAVHAGDALMASPAHRENMLDATYTRVGIGEVTAPGGRTHVYAIVFRG